jgi:2-polyprenyl-3-methyl-5-hydroxy-6-metoxy-1,4-benzoquinol methylase
MWLRRRLKKITSGISKCCIIDLENEELSEKFDVIYTLMTLHHIKDIEKVIKKFSSMLKKNGILFIGDLEKEEGDFHKQENNHDVHFGFDEQYMIDILTSE